ncbi:hypothetical protein [uncultured Campylobacter sp.]|uniref:hypothetical protein n=1 Tax=uncultured Campylobacter sp. TaxID=218934 RepID=UPI0026094818|nr:hypothetical protein [uncultured Campylobacter sp.]
MNIANTTNLDVISKSGIDKQRFLNFIDEAKKFRKQHQTSQVKELDGSLSQKMRENTLSPDEIESLNEVFSNYHIYTSKKYSDTLAYERKMDEFLKTSLSVVEFSKKWGDFSEILKEQFLSELKNSTLKEYDATDTNSKEKSKEKDEPFTPIQAESKSQTFTYDDIAKNFFLTFLENERKKGTDILELLQNLFKIDKNKVDLKA